MKRKINSTWITMIATWDSKLQKNVNPRDTVREKEIEMELFFGEDARPKLKFIGGPTGFEQYFADDLYRSMTSIAADGDDLVRPNVPFCICGGTINSWPRVNVSRAEVYQFLVDAKIMGGLEQQPQ